LNLKLTGVFNVRLINLIYLNYLAE
jgi:hypothetical protein